VSEAAERSRAHLSIGEVLSLLQVDFPDITISKIRFLESQGLLDPERTPSGYRKFYDDDIARLRWILHQQKENFLPLKVIKERLESGELDDPTDVAEATEELVASATKADELDLPQAPAPEPVPEPEQKAARPRRTAPAKPVTAPEVSTSDDGATPERGAARAARDAVRSAPLDAAHSSTAMSRDELADAAGITVEQVADLERFGLLSGRTIGPTTLYDESALGVARLAAGFLRRGVEGRHLKMYRVAAEREASFFQQIVMPQLKQRNPAARQQGIETLGELAELGEGLRAAMLHHALREYLGNG
jgi:DNA-binding transcriptional MerR regulator